MPSKLIATSYRNLIQLVKLLVLVTCMLLIYSKISDQDNFSADFYFRIKELFMGRQALILLVVVSLMPLNWSMEAVKWKILARPLRDMSLAQAFQGVLSGLSVGFVTPHGVGDYIGRIAGIQAEGKGKLIGSVWLGRAMQMLVTLLFGIYGVIRFISFSDHSLPDIGIGWVWLVALCLIVSIIFLSKIKIFGERVSYYFSLVSVYSLSDYLLIFASSFFRYVVFALQFLLVLYAFDVSLNIEELFGGVSWMFLMKSVIPSFNFLSDLGIREWSVLTYFEYFEVSQAAVVASSLTLWVINILFPVLIGLYFVIKLKVQR